MWPASPFRGIDAGAQLGEIFGALFERARPPPIGRGVAAFRF
jgi:hypothetical protein